MATDTWLFGMSLEHRRAEVADEPAVGVDQLGVDDLDVDVDPVDLQLTGQGHELVDELRLGLRAVRYAEQALVAGGPEAAVDQLDPDAAVVGLADQLLAERTDDRLVTLLGRVDRAA